MRLLLDTGILGRLCHPKHEQNRRLAEWLADLMERGSDRIRVVLPEIADYELRRKLIHLAKRTGRTTTKSLDRLNQLGETLDYLPLSTGTMRRAAELWADARSSGRPTAEEKALDGDVILAAQALEVSGIVVTRDREHLSRFVQVRDWEEIRNPS